MSFFYFFLRKESKEKNKERNKQMIRQEILLHKRMWKNFKIDKQIARTT